MRRVSSVAAWADDALEALDDGLPVPPRRAMTMGQVMQALWRRGRRGVTELELMDAYDTKSGRYGAALSLLHEAGAVELLEPEAKAVAA